MLEAAMVATAARRILDIQARLQRAGSSLMNWTLQTGVSVEMDLFARGSTWHSHPVTLTTTTSSAEQTRARYPDQEGFVERDGVRTFYEAYGDGEQTVLLLPTWSLLHSRVWKAQIPYLARHFRVVTFDGRGNGKSDRPSEPEAYTEPEFAGDALAVMDATDTEQAVLVSLSRGA